MLDKNNSEHSVNVPNGLDFNILPSCEVVPLSKYEVAYGLFTFGRKRLKDNFMPRGLFKKAFLELFTKLGYEKLYLEKGGYTVIKRENNIVEAVVIAEIHDRVKNIVEVSVGKGIEFEYLNLAIEANTNLLMETFLRQFHLVVYENFLVNLPNCTLPMLRDTPIESYVPFLNGIVKVNKDGILLVPYSEVKDGYIWKDQIIQRNFERKENKEDCHFYRFLGNVARHEYERLSAFKSGIGYLLHNYNDPSKGQAVICYDEVIPNPEVSQGGTGKGLFMNALKQIRKTEVLDGKKFDAKATFSLQRVSRTTQLVVLDDVNEKFNFDRLNSLLTDGWAIERKFQSEEYIEPEHCPKIIITSNTILDYEGTTRKRRQFILELSDFYSRKIKTGVEQPILEEHGCRFFTDDWNSEEWAKFDALMIECLHIYLKHGLQPYEPVSLLLNRLRQQTSEVFADWVLSKEFELGKKNNTVKYYNELVELIGTDFTRRSFTNYLKAFGESKGWESKFTFLGNQAWFIFFDKSQ